MKAHSNMPFHFWYHYKLEATAAQFFFIKGRPDMVMWVDYVSVYNPTANNFTHLYLIRKNRGEVCRCDYVASLNTKLVKRFPMDHYLVDGEEVGIEVVGSAATDTIDVAAHGLRFKDEDYFKAT